MRAITAISILLFVPIIANGDPISLTGFGWDLSSPSLPNGDAWKVNNVSLPGDVYLTLFENKKIPDPYYKDNDVKLRWISYQNWTYQRSFNLSSEIESKKGHVLVASGLDTIANVYVNDIPIGDASNMHRTYVYDIHAAIRRGENSIRIDFASPVNYTRDQAADHKRRYNYSVPLDCHPSDEHGECHANFIRKMQSHFSWDWGPAFPTMGLSGALRLESFDTCFMKEFSLVPVLDNDAWKLHAEFWIYCVDTSVGEVTLKLSNDELKLDYSWKANVSNRGINRFYKEIPIPNDVSVDLWWPNGLGDQRLYDITGHFECGAEKDSKILEIGFRKVELIQDPIPNVQNGSTFYMKINGVPTFLKGSNWIPGDSFLRRLTMDRLLFYFESMRGVNMNCIRVWGGGVYETDEFYELADQYGITIWQDMMFAVDLYPGTKEFLSNVEAEIDDQINRLKHHASIVIWAGNNENELGIVDGWFPMDAPFEVYKRDYLALYNTTIYGVINRTDFNARPYVLSSPSNGIETMMEGGISKHPGDNMYGDVHFYNYDRDAWNWKTFPTPRCVTEFGYQSFPSLETLKSGLPDDELHYFNPEMIHRQHHPLGEFEMISQMVRQFKFFGAGSSKTMPKFEDIIYLTQIHQAMAYKTEVEHYRRWRSMVNERGEGLTMCALYWQLNDIWQAPTWSSIDYGLKWKAAHYLAKRFFAPVLVSPYIDGENLRIVVVNDLKENFENVTVVLDMHEWSTTGPAYQWNITMPVLKAASSKLIYKASTKEMKSKVNGESLSILFNTRIVDNRGGFLGPNNVLFPDKFRDISGDNFGKVAIGDIQKDGSTMFTVKLVASKIAPFVWLNVNGVQGYFSDNGFAMLDKEYTVVFKSWRNTSLDQFKKNLSVKTLGDLYKKNGYSKWKGLNDSILPYVPLFLNKNVNGAELFTLDEGDLVRIGVTNIRAQQAITLALYQLSDLCFSLDKKNLQTLSMKLGVQSRNLHNVLKFRLDHLSRDANAALGWLPNDVLSYVSALVDDTKEIVNWLDRSPFDTIQQYITVRNTILSFASTIVQSARHPSNALIQTARDIQMACTQLCAISDKIVQEFSDPLILQTAYLERTTVRRKSASEEFGINIESTTDGVHIVSEVKFQSPADFAGKIEAGDEIIQACGHTVVAWPLSKLVAVLNESPSLEAEFLLKKRPRQPYGHQTLSGKPSIPATPQLKKANKPAQILPTLPTVASAVQIPQQLHSKPRRRSSSVSVPRTPVEKVMASEIKPSPPASPKSPIPVIVLQSADRPSEEETIRSIDRTPQRRATVSGGSPTLKRLSLHLNRNISVSPRIPTQWLNEETSVTRNKDRKGDLRDLDIVVVRSRLARPMLNFRASYVNNQLFEPPKGQLLQTTIGKRKNSSLNTGVGLQTAEKLESLEDDVFDMILSELTKRGHDRMPSDSSDPRQTDSSGGSVLELAELDEIPVDAKVNEEEWRMPPLMETQASGEEANISSSGGGGVHKTRSYPGRDATAPKPAQNPLATLPRNSQDKLRRWFGIGSETPSVWYDQSSEAEDSSSIPSPRKSSSQASVASGSWSSKFSPSRSKTEFSGGGVGQVLHMQKKHKDVLPSNSASGSPILTGMRRLTSRRQHSGRTLSTTDSTVLEPQSREARKTSAPPKSSLVDQQILALLGNSGNVPEALRLKLSCYLPYKSIGATDYSGWAYRAKCSFENASTKKWNRRWLVLKKEYLFIYRSTEDTRAEGVLWVLAYRVCPAGPEYRTKKKNVFKLYSTHSSFYFHCYHRQEMLQWLQKLGLAAIGYESQMNNASASELSTDAEFYFASFDESAPIGGTPEVKQRCQEQSASSSPSGTSRNLLQPDSLFNTLRESWRRSHLSRENSNESSLSCHSEGAISTSSSGPLGGTNKLLKVRDPLHVRGGGDARSRSAGRLEDEKDSI